MGIQGNLLLNPEFEGWTGGDPDSWTPTRTNGTGAATVAESATCRFGAKSCQLKITTTDGVASVLTTAFIAVTNTLHYLMRFNHYKTSGADSLKCMIKQYNAAGDDLASDFTITPTGAASWGRSCTVIHATGEAGINWAATCTQVKIKFSVDTTAADWFVDMGIFAPSEGDTLAAFGTKMYINGYQVAELTNIGGPGVKADIIDVTSHDSPDKFREFIAGVKDGGEISIEGNFIPTDTTGQVAAYNRLTDGVQGIFYTFFPSAVGEWLFNGQVTALENTAAYEDQLGFSATVKVTGKPILSLASF